MLPSLDTTSDRDPLSRSHGTMIAAAHRVPLAAAALRGARLGNRVAVAHMDLVNDEGELIATGGAAYMVS